MTGVWPDHWEWVRCGDRLYQLELYGDVWRVVAGHSTVTVITGKRHDALAAIDALDAKIKNGGVDGST